ncbi:MAG TPA: DPP IV N-terminal domain-containing protein, partial [Gemmataceae bacterium]|nr:DPP IV N-terminal domain-containing protein [Gemmataceae bacterium]
MTAASRRLVLTPFLLLVVFTWAGRTCAAEDDVPPQRQGRGRRPPAGVYKTQLTPHWFDDNRRFWYRNDTRVGKEFVVVDAEKGQRAPAFDHEKLAAALSKAAAVKYQADKLPFDSIEYLDGAKAVLFQVGKSNWKCDLTSYECAPADRGPATERPAQRQPPRRPRQPNRVVRSPDGKWTALLKNNNVWLRAADGKEEQLSQDGKEGLAYGLPSWSPDSKALAAFRIEPGERKEV